MIIGIGGTLGAGKGTIVEYLKQKGFVHYSSSGLLTKMLEAQRAHVDRDSMAALAREIRASDPAGVPKLTFAEYEKEKPEHAILESLHTVGEANFIKSVGGVVLGVDADLPVRYERIQKRRSVKDGVDFEKFSAQTKREEESSSDASGHNIRGVIQTADHVIMNNGSIHELHRAVDEFLETFSRRT